MKSTAALTMVQLRPPNMAGAKVYGKRASEPISPQRYELKELVRGVMKAGLRQLHCDDAPEQPDRKAEILGDDRPDEIAAGDVFTCRLPELLILWVPVRKVPFAHQHVPLRSRLESRCVEASPTLLADLNLDNTSIGLLIAPLTLRLTALPFPGDQVNAVLLVPAGRLN